MDDFIPDPSNYKMKNNEAKEAKTAIEEVDPHDDAAVRALARQQLVKMLSAATSPAGIKVAAIKELLDRIDGKPAQNMNIRAAVAHKSEVTIRFIQPEEVE